MRRRAAQRGLTLIELLVATVIGAIVLAALDGLVKIGLDAQVAGRGANELTYQGRFALERIADQARGMTPKDLGVTSPAANASGDWFAPAGCAGAACVMYCRNAAKQLVETTTADAACAGTTIIANNVSAFAVTLPAGMGAVDRPVAVVGLSLDSGSSSVTLSSGIRLGGGTK